MLASKAMESYEMIIAARVVYGFSAGEIPRGSDVTEAAVALV